MRLSMYLINRRYFFQHNKGNSPLICVLVLRLIPIFRIIEPRSNQVGRGVFPRVFRKRDLSSFGIDIQINGLLMIETRYNISFFTTFLRSEHLGRRRHT